MHQGKVSQRASLSRFYSSFGSFWIIYEPISEEIQKKPAKDWVLMVHVSRLADLSWASLWIMSITRLHSARLSNLREPYRREHSLRKPRQISLFSLPSFSLFGEICCTLVSMLYWFSISLRVIHVGHSFFLGFSPPWVNSTDLSRPDISIPFWGLDECIMKRFPVNHGFASKSM